MGCSYIPEELGADVNDEGEVVYLPGSEPKQISPAEAKPAAIEPPKVLKRKDLGIQIMTIANGLCLTKEEIEKWAFEDFKKASKELTIEEMEQFLNTLQEELAGRNALS
jgi:hypothetical protein